METAAKIQQLPMLRLILSQQLPLLITDLSVQEILYYYTEGITEWHPTRGVVQAVIQAPFKIQLFHPRLTQQ